MAQQFNSPKTESELRYIQDELYRISKEAIEKGERPAFKGLIEIMASDVTIMTAIHNIKSNHGSNTPGIDGKTIRDNFLNQPYEYVIGEIQEAFMEYRPQKIRRVYIDKPGKVEKRPLGIPTVKDRIVQECMKIVLEPIMEAQFYAHSYGFRPMRDTAMALGRITDLVHKTGYHWIVEGDISKCFDKIDHRILLRRLYHMGIRDKRVLQISKTMLKAGVMGECEINDEGTAQGGIISPLYANIYLDMLDQWIAKQWQHKKTKREYASQTDKIKILKTHSHLIPGYIVRYADDFVIITDSKEHAEDWKCRLETFLREEMKLELSTTKTLITDVRKKCIKFLGFKYKVDRGKSKKGYIPRTKPDEDRLKPKMEHIVSEIKNMPLHHSREQVIKEIARINSEIRGIINYYQGCTLVNVTMQKYGYKLRTAGIKWLRRYKGKWIRAKKVQNLPRVHSHYKTTIPAIQYKDMWIGLTDPVFVKWEMTKNKNQNETPYSETGRSINAKRTKKKRINARLDELFSPKMANVAMHAGPNYVNNFEFIMNRAYALNRDKLKCRLCGKLIINTAPWTHRINPNLPLNKINRVNNLASMHKSCALAITDYSTDLDKFDTKIAKKIKAYRKKLGCSYNALATNNL